MGKATTHTFHKYHQVLSQAEWSTLQASRILLTQLVSVFIEQGPLVVGIDETLERRWGKRIAAKGIFRDAVRSSETYTVNCSGLRWVSVMALIRIDWAGGVWALSFLTALAPASGYYQGKPMRPIP